MERESSGDDRIPTTKLEKTLVIVMPNAMMETKKIEDVILSDGFSILQKRRIQLTDEQARDFYAEHEGKPSFSALVEHIKTSPVLVMVLSRADAISRWKTIIGPPEPEQEKLYYAHILQDVYSSIQNPQNAIYGSNNPEKAEKDINFFFPENALENIVTGDAARDYLSKTVNPILLKGLVQLCRQKPQNPVVWLADWLLANNPYRPVNEQRENTN